MIAPSRCFTFAIDSEEQKAILIASLDEIGFLGFEEKTDILIGYISEQKFDRNDFEQVIEKFSVKYSESIIPATNWNAAWEADFDPVTVFYRGTPEIFANIRAHFHAPTTSAKHEIIITPKMSFGTGHHATTYGMVECMSLLDFNNKRVIDFGTGTGVLAILAEKMGSKQITAIDNDEWSITNAMENIRLNDCKKIELLQADEFVISGKADIILANINLNVIVANLKMLKNACAEEAIVILSGMLSTDKPVMSAALKEYNLHIKKIYERNNWIIMVVTPEH